MIDNITKEGTKISIDKKISTLHKVVTLTTDTLGMNPLKVEILDHSKMPASNIGAFFVNEPFSIVFSRQWIAVNHIANIVHSAFREVRVAYQHYQVLIKDIGKTTYIQEDPERVERWRKELDNYIYYESGDNLHDENEKPKDTRKRVNLEIVIDALAFANFLIRRLIDEEFAVPALLVDRVIARQIEIAEQFKNEKIFQNDRIIKFKEIIK